MKNKNQESGQDRNVGKHSSSPHTTTTKIAIRLWNKYHPKSSEML